MTRHPRSPYPGLHSFDSDEADFFFGRDECIDGMLERLRETRFLAVLGSSGTGKSSLVKTGLRSALGMGLIAEAGTRWRIVAITPGGTPLRNLAAGLLKCADGQIGNEISETATEALRTALSRRGADALIEYCRERLSGGQNLLLLIDQFEELFRYRGYAAQEEAEIFAELLLDGAHSRAQNIYVALTMRSEYLGPCALIEGLAEAISAGMFLVPRMSREQCRQAIEGPALVCGGEVDAAVVNRLLNDLARLAPWDAEGSDNQLDRLARRADQLPLLQFALNRMWISASDRAEREGEPVRIVLDDYGGLGGALNDAADKMLDGLDTQLVQRVFAALTSGASVADAVRRPTRYDELVAICGGEESAVRRAVNPFRMPGCDFLVPGIDRDKPDPGAPIASADIIDITHESLIRQWRRLSDWLEREGRDAQRWRRLREDAEQRGSAGLLPEPRLAVIAEWRRRAWPNAAWAQRYGDKHDAVTKFVDDSMQAQKRQKSRQRLRYVAAALLVVSIAGVVGWGLSESKARSQLAALEARDRGYRDAAMDYAGVHDLSSLDRIEKALSDRVDAGTVIADQTEFLHRLWKVARDDPGFLRADMLALSADLGWLSRQRPQMIARYGNRLEELGMRPAAPHDHENLTVQSVARQKPSMIARYGRRLRELGERLLNRHDELDIIIESFALQHIAEALDADDANRDDDANRRIAVRWIDWHLAQLQGIEPSHITRLPKVIPPSDLMMVFRSYGLRRKSRLLRHLDEMAKAETALRNGIAASETWWRDLHRPCDRALYGELGSLLIAKSDRESDPQRREVSRASAAEQYQHALACATAADKLSDTFENRRSLIASALSLAEIEELAPERQRAARHHLQLALAAQQKIVAAAAKMTREQRYDAERDLAVALRYLGFFETEYAGNPATGAGYYRRCETELRPLSADPLNEGALALCEKGLGFALRRLQHYPDGRSAFPDAESAYRRAIAELHKAAAEASLTASGELELRNALSDLAVTLLLADGRNEETEQLLSQAAAASLQQLRQAQADYRKKPTGDAARPLADALGDACWFALLTGKAADAAKYADEAQQLKIAPSVALRVNSAHAYLLTGRRAEAEKLYAQSKGSYETADIREDFAVFGKLGLAVPAMDAIKKELGI